MAIETSGAVGSVAAALEGEVVAEESFERGMRHGRELVARLAGLCRRISRPPRTIDAVAVSAGPGSYTGVRVGVTCAKTLAAAIAWLRSPPVLGQAPSPAPRGPGLGKPAPIGVTPPKPAPLGRGEGREPHTATLQPAVIPAALVAVRTLEVLAQNADPQADRVAVVVDARRGQFYAAFFRRDGGELLQEGEDLVLDPGELWTRLTPGTLIVGDAAVRYPEMLRGAGAAPEVRLAGPEAAVARARHVARLGWRDFSAGRTLPPHDLTPIYLRRPEAVDRLLSRHQRDHLPDA